MNSPPVPPAIEFGKSRPGGYGRRSETVSVAFDPRIAPDARSIGVRLAEVDLAPDLAPDPRRDREAVLREGLPIDARGGHDALARDEARHDRGGNDRLSLRAVVEA